MTVEQKVYEVLAANAALTAVVPASRIKVPGLHQNLDAPYIIHMGVGPAPRYTHEGLQTLVIWEFYQISVVANSYSEGNTIAGLVVNALTGTHGEYRFFWQGGHYSGRDDELGLEQFNQDWRIAAVR